MTRDELLQYVEELEDAITDAIKVLDEGDLDRGKEILVESLDGSRD